MAEILGFIYIYILFFYIIITIFSSFVKQINAINKKNVHYFDLRDEGIKLAEHDIGSFAFHFEFFFNLSCVDAIFKKKTF